MADSDADARRLLFEGLVDYAGLFPPAALPMAGAVARYDEYRRGPQAWALGNFVVPIARLTEFEHAAEPHFGDAVWPLALLTGADFGADVAAIVEFAARAIPRAAVAAIETKAATSDEVVAVARHAVALRSRIGTAFDVYVEVPIATDPRAMVAAIAAHGLRAKVRTGGVESGAFPTAGQLAHFVSVCAAHNVTFKATAGLHHAIRGTYPLTYEPASASGMMFGFLNVFLAALFVHDGLGETDARALLEERDPDAFTFTTRGVTWRGHTLTAESIRDARRHAATSFGSCSFAEPTADLLALGLL